MASALDSLDWTHVRSFLAVAEAGSLSAAARRTGISQPTLGRHIKALETALGAQLFRRDVSGLDLTEHGARLLEPAREMAEASARFSARATGQDARISGTVRITASVVVSHFLLPAILADLRLQSPEIEIELLPSDTPENLLYREADIAIRMFRPTQLDVVARKVAEQPMALYAAASLVERFGQPQSLDDLAAMPFVGFDRSDLILRHIQAAGIPADRHFFGTRCDDQAAYWHLVRAGCGVGAMQCAIGDTDPAVERLALQPPVPSLPIWLAAQEDVYKSARVRRVWSFLAERLKR